MTELTEKNLADALRNAHAEHSETDWTALARKAAELMGVDLSPEPKPLPTEPGSVIIATEVRGKKGEWRAFLEQDGNWTTSEFINSCIWHNPMRITAWTEALVVPVGEKIDLDDVQVGDRVRVVLDNGDEATFTVINTGTYSVSSETNAFYTRNIRTIHLLNREDPS